MRVIFYGGEWHECMYHRVREIRPPPVTVHGEPYQFVQMLLPDVGIYAAAGIPTRGNNWESTLAEWKKLLA